MSDYRDSDVKIDGFNLTRGQVLEIYCQECGAKPGERCHSKYGRVRYEPHFLRKADREEGTDPGPAAMSKVTGPRWKRMDLGASAVLGNLTLRP
jgi:hypothetical protein